MAVIGNPLLKFEKSNVPEQKGIRLGKNMNYITPEMRAYASEYCDPLEQNFKLMINFNKPYGLFAPETSLNSALAYLNRIGEVERFEMLKHWIERFRDFVRNYDFLILGVDGLDAIVNKKLSETFTEADKITINIRETIDMRFQSLLTIFKSIWFDEERKVEVIPVNLRRFDISILIYSGNYYNMALYDIQDGDQPEDSPDALILPTLSKISSNFFNNLSNPEKLYFNHHMIYCGDCEINNEESGKNFFENISNDPSNIEQTKNCLTFNFRFAHYNGIFNNIFGNFDFVKLLAIAAAQDKVANQVSFLKQMKQGFKQAATDTFRLLKSKVIHQPDKFLNKNTVIGNALNNITDPQFLVKMVKNTADLGITMGDEWISGKIAQVNNMVQMNFSDNFVTTYHDFFDKHSKNIETIPTPQKLSSTVKPGYAPGSSDSTEEKGIQYRVDNIYTRKAF